MDPTKGLFRRRPSTASTRSRLRTQASTSSSALGSSSAINAQSCPTSPKHSPGTRLSLGEQKIPEDEEAHHTPTPVTLSEAAEYAAAINDSKREQQQRQQQQHQQLQQSQQQPLQKSPPSRARNTRVSSAGSRMTTTGAEGAGVATVTGTVTVAGSVAGGRCNRQENENVSAGGGASGPMNLQRSASTVSGLAVRPYSSPARLHSYTGSVPSSVHGSRLDLREIDKGSAIYLGCSAPRHSSLSLSSRGSSGSSAPPSPVRTPPVSPRHAVRRSASLVKKQR